MAILPGSATVCVTSPDGGSPTVMAFGAVLHHIHQRHRTFGYPQAVSHVALRHRHGFVPVLTSKPVEAIVTEAT